MPDRYFYSKKFDNFKDFYITIILENKLNIDFSCFVFRGESDSNYTLLPSALRPKNKCLIAYLAQSYFNNNNNLISLLSNELTLAKLFYDLANSRGLDIPHIDDFLSYDVHGIFKLALTNYHWIPSKYYNIFSLAQHYGIPTRLLDWTYDIHTALFFSAYNAYIKMVQETKEDFSKSYFVIWFLNYKGLSFFALPLQSSIKFIYPRYKNNKFITAQQGLFSLDEIVFNKENADTEPDIIPLDEKIKSFKDFNLVKEPLIYKFLISYKATNDAMEFLNRIKYSYLKIFPSFENIKHEILDRARNLKPSV